MTNNIVQSQILRTQGKFYHRQTQLTLDDKANHYATDKLQRHQQHHDNEQQKNLHPVQQKRKALNKGSINQSPEEQLKQLEALLINTMNQAEQSELWQQYGKTTYALLKAYQALSHPALHNNKQSIKSYKPSFWSDIKDINYRNLSPIKKFELMVSRARSSDPEIWYAPVMDDNTPSATHFIKGAAKELVNSAYDFLDFITVPTGMQPHIDVPKKEQAGAIVSSSLMFFAPFGARKVSKVSKTQSVNVVIDTKKSTSILNSRTLTSKHP